ncbi:hypothetical protein Tsubulata_031024 [Turnera subulata]|uniref:Uncharacterized protein n=1 Tax=Turnera subulata TaxID=218843 RepID=A0A9Q0G8D9_9ROSI|nr:hypothetical protein Tsubulata_031024 [Turnera subulata]
MDGRPGVLEPIAGPELTHESDDSHSSDLEVLGTGNGASCGEYNSPFVTSKPPTSLIIIEDDMQCNGNCGSARSTVFKTRLIKVLDKAYNEKEYLELMAKVSCKKPVERERMLRGSTKQYPSDIMGKSYLDQHREELQLVRGKLVDGNYPKFSTTVDAIIFVRGFETPTLTL